MTDIYQIASIGMQDANLRVDTISQNAASASAPGYRRHVVQGRPFAAAFDKAAAGPTQAAVDLRSGGLSLTGRSLDLAVESDDLFFALTDGTQTWLTRAGSFRLNDEGVLVGERGLRVVGPDGDVRLPGTEVAVEADGRITQQGTAVGAVQLFRPVDRASVMAAAGSLLTAAAGIEPVDAESGRVRSGALEGSNTQMSAEMVGLMSIARQFEALGRVVQGYDGVLQRAIEKLAEI
ncbi:MAG TPA: flagellar hook basal-body protein [Steroidobacteraceae bacterium]